MGVVFGSGIRNRANLDKPGNLPLAKPCAAVDNLFREVGGRRSTRQSGQIRKEAAPTGWLRVICPASCFYADLPPVLMMIVIALPGDLMVHYVWIYVFGRRIAGPK
jgi:hypothetical protein